MNALLRLYLVVSLGVLSAGRASDDEPFIHKVWAKGLRGDVYSFARSSWLDRTGDFFVLIETTLGPSLFKFSGINGRPVWQQPLGFIRDRRFTFCAVSVDANGNAFCVVASNYPSQDTIVCLSPDRDLIWSRRFPKRARGIAVDHQGDVIVTGGLTIKYSGKDGAVLWRRENSAEFDFTAVVADQADDIMLGGVDSAIYVEKCSGVNGKSIWSRAHTQVPFQEPSGGITALVTDRARNVVVLATIGTNDKSTLFSRLTRYSPSGDVLWERNDRDHYSDLSAEICLDSRGDVIITDSSFRLSKYLASDGSLKWQKDLGSSRYFFGSPGLAVDENDDIITATVGAAPVLDYAYHLFYVTKFEGTEGALRWKQPFRHGKYRFGPTASFRLGPGYVIATGNDPGSAGLSVSSTKYASGPTPRTLEPEVQDGENAVLVAEVNPNGFKSNALFLYGSDSELRSPSSTPPTAIGTGILPVPVSARISGLLPGITYYYRAVGISIQGETVRGEVRSFRTDGSPP